jgi:hypothetical protein
VANSLELADAERAELADEFDHATAIVRGLPPTPEELHE